MTGKVDEKSNSSGDRFVPNPKLLNIQLGVYQVSMIPDTSSWSRNLDLKKRVKDINTTMSLLRRFVGEMFRTDPLLFTLFALSKTWTGVQHAVMIYFSNQILQSVRYYTRYIHPVYSFLKCFRLNQG